MDKIRTKTSTKLNENDSKNIRIRSKNSNSNHSQNIIPASSRYNNESGNYLAQNFNTTRLEQCTE
jgi:hypothetical protein